MGRFCCTARVPGGALSSTTARVMRRWLQKYRSRAVQQSNAYCKQRPDKAEVPDSMERQPTEAGRIHESKPTTDGDLKRSWSRKPIVAQAQTVAFAGHPRTVKALPAAPGENYDEQKAHTKRVLFAPLGTSEAAYSCCQILRYPLKQPTIEF